MNIVATVVMVRGCFAPSVPGGFLTMRANLKFFGFYQIILKGNIGPSAHGLKLKSTWGTLQDNDLKRSSGSTLIKTK